MVKTARLPQTPPSPKPVRRGTMGRTRNQPQQQHITGSGGGSSSSASASASAASAASRNPTFYLNISAEDTRMAAAFYDTLGFAVLDLGDEHSRCLRFPAPNANMSLMIHGRDRFRTYMRPAPDNQVVDAHVSTEALFSIAVDSREQVDAWLSNVFKAGGDVDPYVLPGYGAEYGMYSRSFADIDGHIWEIFFLFDDEEDI